MTTLTDLSGPKQADNVRRSTANPTVSQVDRPQYRRVFIILAVACPADAVLDAGRPGSPTVYTRLPRSLGPDRYRSARWSRVLVDNREYKRGVGSLYRHPRRWDHRHN